MNDNDITVAKELKKLGYTTACIGKWGIGHPPLPDDPKRNGFDYFYGYLSMWHAHNYYPEFLWRNGEKVRLNNVVQRPEDHYKPGQAELTGLASKKEDYTPDLFTDDALNFIENHETPFFLFLSYTIPHTNNEAEWFGTHGMEVPELGKYKDEDWPDAEKSKAAMITRLDGYVGMIMKKLEELGIDEQTLVMFSSDNGPHQESGTDPYFFNSNGSLRGIKRDLYEGGIRVPAIAYWSKTISPGIQSDLISAFWDILPTFVDAAGGEIPSGIDGISFLPTLLGNTDKQKQHDYLYWEFHEGSSKQAVRMGKWKGVRIAPSIDTELYNLDIDAEEKNNIASEHPVIIKQIENIFIEARTNEDRWPLRDNINQIDTDQYKMK
jgi:arylsulfatase A-like enzyme